MDVVLHNSFDKSQRKALQTHNHHFEDTHSERPQVKDTKERVDPLSNNKKLSLL
eukprot:c13225_g1_i1 orf=105-266(+)